MVPSGNFQNGCLAFAGLSFRRVKRGITSSSKIHEAYFFDDYDIYSLGEGCGLMREKLLAFHASTVNDVFLASTLASPHDMDVMDEQTA